MSRSEHRTARPSHKAARTRRDPAARSLPRATRRGRDPV